MNTGRMNRWLTLVANISVVAGIIFLAVEIRQNTESIDESRRLGSANAYQARAFHFSSMNVAVASAPEMVDAIVAFRAAGGLDNPKQVIGTLSPQDQLRVRWFYLSRIAMYDNNFYQYRNGYLEEDRYQSIDVPIIKDEAKLWEAMGYDLHTPAMRDEINRIRSE